MKEMEELRMNKYHVAARDPDVNQGRGESGTSLERLCPSVADSSMDERKSFTVDGGGALQEGDGSERRVVGRASVHSVH